MSDRKLQPDEQRPDAAPAPGEATSDAAEQGAPVAGAAPGEDANPTAATASAEQPAGGQAGGAPADQGADAQPAGDAQDPLASALRERDEFLDLLRRERAEFENYRRRAMREQSEAMDRGAEQLVSRLLSVLDNFGYVLEAAKDSTDEALAKGAEMVYEELMTILRQAGLQVVPGVGEPFDPVHHEAVMQVEAAEPLDHPVVAEVLRTGYRFKDRLLRPASVSVAQ